MQESGAFPETAEILEILKDDPTVDTERVESATVNDRAEECVDFVSEIALEVTERVDQGTFPQSEYEHLCRQRVAYTECYDYAPEDFSDQTIEFVEMGCQPQWCGECDGDGKTVCSSCGGSGTERCTNCGGSGKSACSACSGTGDQPAGDDVVACISCGGSGEVTCDAPGCNGGQKVCRTCSGSGMTECSLCNGEETVVIAAHGAIDFTKTRTVQTEATEFNTDLFEFKESDGTLVERSHEEPTDRIGEEDGDNQVWRRTVEQRSVPCVSVTYEYDDETYTVGWVDGEVRLGEYPPSEATIREQIERAANENQFTYDNSPEDGIKSLIIADTVKTVKTLLWLFGVLFIGLLAASVFDNTINVLFGFVGTTTAGAVALIVPLGASLYLTARLHKRTQESQPGRSVAAIAGPAFTSVVAVVLLATGEVSLMLGASLFGFAATFWGVSVARHLQSVAEEAAVISDRRQMFLTETLDYPPEVVSRHELGGLLPPPLSKTERRANRVAAIVGIGCVGLAGLYTLGTVMISLLQSMSTPMSAQPAVAVVGVLSLPAILTLVSAGALIGIGRQ